MKIAYLINTYPQSSQSFIRREIAALQDMGVHVERFTVRRWKTPLVDSADQAEARQTRCLVEAGPLRMGAAVGWTALRHPLRFLAALVIALRLGWRSDRGWLYNIAYFAEACLLLGWLKSSGIDHVHAHFGTNSTALALLCRRLGGPPYSFTVHGPEEFDRPVALKLTRKIVDAQFVVAVSEYGRSQLYRWCGAEQWCKIHVVRCGVEAAFAAAEGAACTAARLVCVGRFAAQKGQLLLIQAAQMLARQNVKFELVLIGDGAMRPRIEAAIAQSGLGESVRLLGWQSNQEVRRQILLSRALVLPSLAEGLPVVLMEALALRRPVIATSVAGIPERVEDGQCGYLVGPGDVPALAQAMIRMLGLDAGELDRMGRLGAQKVAANHNSATEARRLAALFGLSVPAQ